MLYDKGYRSRNNTKIHHNTIGGIIQNPKYKGYYCGNKVRVVDYRTKEQRFLPEDEWVMYKDETGDVVPAIVPEDMWDKCNEIFKERSDVVKRKERSIKNKSVFTGKIFCSDHGKPFWRTSYSNSASRGKCVYQWVCSEKKKNGAKYCDTTYLLESELYSMLSDVFSDMHDNILSYIDTFIEIYKSENKDSNLEIKIASLKSRMMAEEKKREKLLEIYVEGEISKREFVKRNDMYSVIITDLENDISALKKKKESESNHFNSIKRIEKYFSDIYIDKNGMTKDQVDELSIALIERIYVTAINSNSMKITIKLKTNHQVDKLYEKSRDNSICRSGIIDKKMIPEQQFVFQHINRRSLNHISESVFFVSVKA